MLKKIKAFLERRKHPSRIILLVVVGDKFTDPAGRTWTVISRTYAGQYVLQLDGTTEYRAANDSLLASHYLQVSDSGV